MKFCKTCHKVVAEKVVNAADLSKQCSCYRSGTATVSLGVHVASSVLIYGPGSGRMDYGERESRRLASEALLVARTERAEATKE